MLFTSLECLAFVVALTVLYYVVPKRAQWPILLIASLAFYWFADPRYLIFICVTATIIFVSGILMNKADVKCAAELKARAGEIAKEEKKAIKAKTKTTKRRIMVLGLVLALGILCVTKYTNFVINNINGFLTDPHKLATVNMIVPMGISFYTFQACGYIIDVYRGKHEAERNPLKFLLFVSFFPQLVQGPISRFSDLSATLYEPHQFSWDNMNAGLTRIVWGYFKKLVVADRIITAVTALISDTAYEGTYVFVAMMFYAFELYCDFTGGIDITIGIAKVLGIDLKENFNLPYFSKNIKEYWNRWHITMGTWFTDYIFYPLSVSPTMLKLSKWSRQHLGNAVGKRVTVYISCFCVWLATGIWHGAAWHFVVWGLMNFVVIMASQELEPLYAKFHGKYHFKGKKWYSAFEIVRTFLLMSSLKLFDCYRNVGLTFRMFGSMFVPTNIGRVFGGALLELGLGKADYTVAFLAVVIVFLVSLYRKLKGRELRERLYELYPCFVLCCVVLFLATMVFGAYGAGFDASQFIYNQF